MKRKERENEEQTEQTEQVPNLLDARKHKQSLG